MLSVVITAVYDALCVVPCNAVFGCARLLCSANAKPFAVVVSEPYKTLETAKWFLAKNVLMLFCSRNVSQECVRGLYKCV